jgi:hypothetical protein
VIVPVNVEFTKVKELVQTFGLTAEHLGLTSARGKTSVTRKSKPKQTGAGKIKYADPKTGKTWSGFGRAPAWIAAARNRDAFLVDKSGVVISAAPVKANAASKKAAKPARKIAKPARKPSARKTARAGAATAPTRPTKKPATKKANVKAPSKKLAGKKVVSRDTAIAAKPDSASTAGE